MLGCFSGLAAVVALGVVAVHKLVLNLVANRAALVTVGIALVEVNVLCFSYLVTYVTVDITSVVVNVACGISDVIASVTILVAVVVVDVRSDSLKSANVAICVALVFPNVIRGSSLELANVTYAVAIVIKDVLDNSLVRARGIVALGVAYVVEDVGSNSFGTANVTVGIALVGIFMYDLGILSVTYVTSVVAGGIVGVILSDSRSGITDSAVFAAIGAVYVRSRSLKRTSATSRIAIVRELMSYVS